MCKIPVIYWSYGGSTQTMAEAVAEAITAAGGEAMLLQVFEISAEDAAEYPVLALGCPAMGVEELEQETFEPFFTLLEHTLQGKKIGLFGSYGWGGSYMQLWESRVLAAGAELVADGVLAMGPPDEPALAQCAELGSLLAAQARSI